MNKLNNLYEIFCVHDTNVHALIDYKRTKIHSLHTDYVTHSNTSRLLYL